MWKSNFLLLFLLPYRWYIFVFLSVGQCIEVVVHIKEQGYNENDLVKAGIEVQCHEELSIQCAVIDKSIVWYGNINFFGYNAEDNNVMRIDDSMIAGELLDVLFASGGNSMKLW